MYSNGSAMSDLQVTGDRLARDGRRQSKSSTGRRDDPGPYRDKDTGNADDGARRGQAGRLGGEPDEDGLVEVRKHLAGQGETPIRRLGPGDCFGEIALLGDHVRTASTHSLTSANVLAIDRDACQALLSSLPPLRDFFNRLLEERMGMRPESGSAPDVSNAVTVHTTQEGPR